MYDLTVKANKYEFVFILNPVLYGNIKPVIKPIRQINFIMAFLENSKHLNINYEVLL